MSTDVGGVGKDAGKAPVNSGTQIATVKPKTRKQEVDEWLKANAAELAKDPDLAGVAKEYSDIALREHKDSTEISPHKTPQALATYVKVLQKAGLIVSEGQYADITDGLDHLNTHNVKARVRPGQLAIIANSYIVLEHEDDEGEGKAVQVDFEELGQELEGLYLDYRFSFGDDINDRKGIDFDQFVELLCVYPKHAGLDKKVSLDDAALSIKDRYEELCLLLPKPGSPLELKNRVKQTYCVLFSESLEGKEDTLGQAVKLIQDQWSDSLKPGGFTEHDVCLMLHNYGALQEGSGFLDLEAALTDINASPLEILNKKITDLEESSEEEQFDPDSGDKVIHGDESSQEETEAEEKPE